MTISLFLVCFLLTFKVSTGNTESYVGCFQDVCSGGDGDCEGQFSFILSYTQRTDISLTVDRCIIYCLGLVSSTVYIQYAGVENGNDCYCGLEGSDYDQHGRRSDADCNTPCPGDSTQMCGGEYAIAVYDLYRIRCRVPGSPLGGASQYLVEVGTTVTFTCNTGYYLDGTSTLQCISTGSPTWNGEVPMCTQVVCSPSCMHGGQCGALNRCSCTRQFTGDHCQTPVCYSFCMNGGTCSAPDTCECLAGYVGDQCQTPVCSPSCMNGGTCAADNTCTCGSEYTGDQCQTDLTGTTMLTATTDNPSDVSPTTTNNNIGPPGATMPTAPTDDMQPTPSDMSPALTNNKVAIIAGVAGGLVLLCLVIILLVCVRKMYFMKSQSRQSKQSSNQTSLQTNGTLHDPAHNHPENGHYVYNETQMHVIGVNKQSKQNDNSPSDTNIIPEYGDPNQSEQDKSIPVYSFPDKGKSRGKANSQSGADPNGEDYSPVVFNDDGRQPPGKNDTTDWMENNIYDSKEKDEANSESGWKTNSVYASASPQMGEQSEAGWEDNSVYTSSSPQSRPKETEGWKDNTIYVTSN